MPILRNEQVDIRTELKQLFLRSRFAWTKQIWNSMFDIVCIISRQENLAEIAFEAG